MHVQKVSIALLVLALSIHPISALAETSHTALQERQEQSGQTKSGSGRTTQTRAQMGAVEEKVPGHDAHKNERCRM
jgi:hypothetical protein